MSGYKVAKLDEIEEVTDGRSPLRRVRHELGITAFGVNSWTGHETGDRIINEHTQNDEEELYVVLTGRARFEVGDDKVDAPAGTFVFVAPDERRTAFAEEADTTILAIGSVPGEPYQADGWELWAPAAPYYRSGDYEAAIDVLRPVAEANPQFPTLFYNLACLESLAGRPEDAIEHLGRAIALSERSRTAARDDSDFDPIREQPGFKRLVEVPS